MTSDIVRNIKILNNTGQYYPIISKIAQYCPILSNIVQYCSIMFKWLFHLTLFSIVRNIQIIYKIFKCCLILSDTDKYRPVAPTFSHYTSYLAISCQFRWSKKSIGPINQLIKKDELLNFDISRNPGGLFFHQSNFRWYFDAPKTEYVYTMTR